MYTYTYVHCNNKINQNFDPGQILKKIILISETLDLYVQQIIKQINLSTSQKETFDLTVQTDILCVFCYATDHHTI